MNDTRRLSMMILCGLSLSLILTQGLGAGNEKHVPKNLFFAFDNGVKRAQGPPQQRADVLKELGYAGIGYAGPIGWQCYNIKGDIRENLERSMKAWDELWQLLDPR